MCKNLKEENKGEKLWLPISGCHMKSLGQKRF